MIEVTYKGRPALLLDDEPNWARRVQATFGVVTERQQSLTGREERVALSQALRVRTLRFMLTLEGEAIDTFREALRTAGDKPILVPFWPAESASIGLVTGGVSFTPDNVAVPVLRGYFSEAPSIDYISGAVATVHISFVESSAADEALVIAAQTFQNGAPIAGRVVKVFPVIPNWVSQVSAGRALSDVQRTQIGNSREPAEVRYPQDARRQFEASYTLDGWGETAQLLRFFADHFGDLQTFWLGDVSEEEPQLLMRFAKPELTIAWTSSEVAEVNLAFSETPPEYAAPAGETLGVTLGAKSRLAYLYKFTLAGYPDWRMTSYERDINWSGSTYKVASISHKEIGLTLNLESTEVQFSTRYFWHETDFDKRHPIGLFQPFVLEAPLRIEVYECSPDANGYVASAQRIFGGEVIKPEFEGPIVSFRAKNVASLFSQRVPRMLMQPTDCYAAYSMPFAQDGDTAEAWAMTCPVVQWTGGSTQLIIGQPTAGPTAHPGFVIEAKTFAGGRLEAGIGTAREARGIMDSALSAGNIVLTLRMPLSTNPETVTVWPGYDGQYQTSIERFDNDLNFGGFPFLPIGNPSLIKVAKNNSSGGKK